MRKECIPQQVPCINLQDGIDFNLCFILGTNFDEVNQHYGERGYRFSLLYKAFCSERLKIQEKVNM